MPYFSSSAQCGDMVGESQVLGSAFLRSASDLAGARSSMSHTAMRRDEAVVVALPERRLEEEVAGLLEADQRLLLEGVALHVGVAGLPVERACAPFGLQHRIGHEQAGRFHVGDEHARSACRAERSRASMTPTLSAKISWPSLSTTPQRSPSPSKPKPTSALLREHRLAHGVQHLHVFGVGIVAREGVVEIAVERHDLAADALPARAAQRRRPCRCRRPPPP